MTGIETFLWVYFSMKCLFTLLTIFYWPIYLTFIELQELLKYIQDPDYQGLFVTTFSYDLFIHF
jgi:hypothetical protein